ncbi:hypothetical protein GJAV_G00067660 [Gymnothorax javanicus]|nr:hypothetical protein GJAV_G00067660 [Gymnothorax javanicus]
MSADSVGSDAMDCKGCSLPLMPDPPNPVSVKQPPVEPLGSRKGCADKSADPALLMTDPALLMTDPALLMTDPALLMDQAAAQLAVTLQDTVLQKMAGQPGGHERLKDLTSRLLNGEQDKPAKICAPEGPLLLKGVEPVSPHTSPQRKSSSSPELKLQITKLVSNGTPPLFQAPRFGEDAARPEPTGTPAKATVRGKKRKRPLKAKPKPLLLNATVNGVSENGHGDVPEKVCVEAGPVAQVKEEELQVPFSIGDVVWTKVAGFPWWPCLVTRDPVRDNHVKQKAVISRTVLMYHVQFFGETAEHGYASEKLIVLFTGEEQYQDLCRGAATPNGSSSYKGKKPFGLVPLQLLALWNLAVSQAKQAVAMALEERLAKFTFTYSDGQAHLNPHQQAELECTPGPGQDGLTNQNDQLMDPALPLHNGSECWASALREETDCERRRGLRPANKGRTPQATSSLEKQSKPQKISQQPLQAPSTALLREELQKACALTDSGLLKKTAQLVVCLTGLPAPPTLDRPKPIPAKETAKEKRKSASKAPKRVKMWQQILPRPLNWPMPPERAASPKKRLKPDSTTAGKTKLVTKSAAESKKRRPKASSAPTSESKPLKKRGRAAGARSPDPTPRKRRALPCPELERAESPSDSTDELHGSRKGERNGVGRKENICLVCDEAAEDLLPCEGQCCGTFHLQCLGLSCRPQGKLLCKECSSGLHSCFSCKRSDGEVRRCSVLHCGRFYHEACARLSPLAVFETKGFRCPLHTCLSCHYSTRSRPKARKGKMMRCIRCPVAYHAGEQCVAAGSETLTSSAIICTNHFVPKKGYSQHSHVNVSWCFVCSKGGSLLCCESCPAAFHPDCLNIAMPDGSWYCNDCRAGRKPKYRDIIWVKLGNYRWWPAEVRHPRSIPSNIQHLRHEIGEFPVFFFGSRDYFWTHQGRVFPYMEGDRGNKYQKTGIGKVFRNALQEAESRFREVKQEREAKEAQENDRKPPPYKYIKVNKPYGRVQIYTADISEIPKCNCKPSDEKPCGFESECLNRMLMYECHPQVCPAGEHCHNQGFTKRQYPDTKIIKTAGKGWGLIALRDIKKGEFVNEYVGELIDEVECHARIKYAQENDITHFYMLTIDKDRIIDAGPKGNYSRFMNHSCQPNCETQKWTVNGDTRVGLFAVCDIPAGTELTFNYNLDCLGNEKTVCRCGAPNCSGFLGDRPKNSSQASEVKGKKVKKKPRKRRARSEGRKRSEDECFRCGDGGELVLCDKKSCTKAYHLSCLDRTKRPFGRWDCPWHHCDVCGKNSEVFCQLCPNSFCKAHQEGALRLWGPTGQLCCQEHEDMELRPILDRREAEVPLRDGPRAPKTHKRS